MFNNHISYKLAGPEVVRAYEIKNGKNIKGANLSVTGVCEDARGNIHELVNAPVKIISKKDNRLKIGIPQKGVVAVCDPAKSGDYVLAPITKKKGEDNERQ